MIWRTKISEIMTGYIIWQFPPTWIKVLFSFLGSLLQVWKHFINWYFLHLFGASRSPWPWKLKIHNSSHPLKINTMCIDRFFLYGHLLTGIQLSKFTNRNPLIWCQNQQNIEATKLDRELEWRKNHCVREKWWLVGGWTNPFEKYARQIGSFPQGSGVKIKNIWNHHLENVDLLWKVYHSSPKAWRSEENHRNQF